MRYSGDTASVTCIVTSLRTFCSCRGDDVAILRILYGEKPINVLVLCRFRNQKSVAKLNRNERGLSLPFPRAKQKKKTKYKFIKLLFLGNKGIDLIFA